MEPLTAGAIAVGTIVATKVLEKTTEKGTEILLEKAGKFLALFYASGERKIS